MAQQPPESAHQADQGVEDGCRAALEAPRRADACQLPHQEPEVEAADVYKQTLEDIRVGRERSRPPVLSKHQGRHQRRHLPGAPR